MAEHKRLQDAVEDYIKMRTARKAATTATNEAYVLRRFAAWAGEIQLRHLHPDKVAEWFYGENGLMSSHVTRDRVTRAAIKPSTHNYYRIRLAGFFRFCTQRGWIRDDLLRDVEPLPIPHTVRQQPPPHTLLRMLEVTDNARDRAYIAVAINTGLRASEIVALRVGDVHLDRGYLTVVIKKTGDIDDQPITVELDVELRRWLTKYGVDLNRPLRKDDYLFPGRRASVYKYEPLPDGSSNRMRTQPSWRPEAPLKHSERVVQGALRALGLPTLHEGTHTVRRAVARAFFDSLCASELGYDGALRTVSALLHHKSSTTTEKYLGLTSERRRRDQLLRGRSFLTAMVNDTNVVPGDFRGGSPTADEAWA